MSNLLKRKQIEAFQIGRMGVINFSASGLSDVVTTEITASAGTDGVPVQVGALTTEGFITTGANNKVLIFDTSSKQAIDDGLGNEVFGRLTEAAGVFTLTYFSLQSGVETAVTLPATSIDFFVNYNYSFKNLPNDILVRVHVTEVGEDPASQAGRPIRDEKLPVTATNVLTNLAFTPLAGSVSLFVNGVEAAEGASESFTRVAKVITWDPTDAKYDLETTDSVTAHYNTLES